jgi:hypothetical protein
MKIRMMRPTPLSPGRKYLSFQSAILLTQFACCTQRAEGNVSREGREADKKAQIRNDEELRKAGKQI